MPPDAEEDARAAAAAAAIDGAAVVLLVLPPRGGVRAEDELRSAEGRAVRMRPIGGSVDPGTVMVRLLPVG
jgi:hypothetical protein